MASQPSNLENLGQFLNASNFPAFNRMGVSPAQIQRFLEEGIAHHREGNGPEAERCYRQVLEIAPNQPDALNLLGVLAAEADLLDLAIGLMDRALHDAAEGSLDPQQSRPCAIGPQSSRGSVRPSRTRARAEAGFRRSEDESGPRAPPAQRAGSRFEAIHRGLEFRQSSVRRPRRHREHPRRPGPI